MDASKYHRFNTYKILIHGDRLRQIAEGLAPFPVDWHIYPSNICNHSCSWCMFRQNGEQFDHRTMLPRELLFKAVHDAARTGGKLVHFSGGGEPLLNPSTAHAIQKASALGLATALSTNGFMLTPEVAASTDYIRVSLNAGTKEQHDRTNHDTDGRSDWERILEKVSSSLKYKKKDLGLGFVADHENWRDIYPFCALAAKLRVDFVHIRPAFWYDSDDNNATRSSLPDILRESDRAKVEFGSKIPIFSITDKFESYWAPRSYTKCRAVLTGTCLTATGDFAVCQDRTDLRFGANYRTGASFEDIWLSEEHLQLVDQITSPGQLDRCPRCVWNARNEIIEHAFVRDDLRLDLV